MYIRIFFAVIKKDRETFDVRFGMGIEDFRRLAGASECSGRRGTVGSCAAVNTSEALEWGSEDSG